MSAIAIDDLARHVYSVQRYIAITSPRYAPLLGSRIPTQPICCFGDPFKARVISVVVNPSIGEFSKSRDWAPQMNHATLANRCRDYFQLSQPSPHPWFKPWTAALNELGVAYKEGSAVHIDL